MNTLYAVRLGLIVLCLGSFSSAHAGEPGAIIVIQNPAAMIVTDGDVGNRQMPGVGSLVKTALTAASRWLWHSRDVQAASAVPGQQPASLLSAANYNIDVDAEKIGMRITWKF